MADQPEAEDARRQKILEALAAGRKIEAIKLYREMTGLGLKESKDAVDKLEAELAEKNPNEFRKPKAGCATVLLLVLFACLAGVLAHATG
ncbi:MAG: ribosomal protein L7/L12 [Planctomycetes bacterium]|nr:ribosomal protein L7/L12 [Planctomycetota bacterium]